MATHRYYRDSNTALTESGVLVRPALLLTEGEITDSAGRKTTYTRERLDAIAATSNEYCATQEVKFFTDHDYSQKARIGAVTGKFIAREITDLDLPENADRSSIGKYAIFNDGIEIRDEKAIAKYHAKLLKELSIGIILSGDTGTIFEVSAVPWGAVKEAHIYSGISKLKDCEKGKPCGDTCIALDKECDPTTRFPKLTREGKGGPVTQETKIGENTVKTKISRDPTQDFDPPPWVRKIDIYVNGGFEKTSIEGKEGLKLALASKEHVREYVRSAPEGSILSNTPFRDDGFGDQRVKLYEKAGFSSPNAEGVMFSIVVNQKNTPITLDEIKELKNLNHIKEAG